LLAPAALVPLQDPPDQVLAILWRDRGKHPAWLPMTCYVQGSDQISMRLFEELPSPHLNSAQSFLANED
jgi:hypothetical protein